MGTSYYMVKGTDKVYVGKNVITDDIPVLFVNYEKIMKMTWTEDEEYWNLKDTPTIKLSLNSMGLLYDRLKLYDMMIELFEHPFLLSFFIQHDDGAGWELKPDYELEADEHD